MADPYLGCEQNCSNVNTINSDLDCVYNTNKYNNYQKNPSKSVAGIARRPNKKSRNDMQSRNDADETNQENEISVMDKDD